jgi:hypothetical protein
MKRTVTRLFDRREDAERAVDELERMGLGHDEVSLVARNYEDREGKSFGDDSRRGDDPEEPGKSAARGAATGGLIGGGAGLLAGLGLLAIPGIGPLVGAGWLVSTLGGAAAGAAGGGAAGGIVGALKDAGHSEEEADVYAEGVRRGATLVTVRTDENRVSEVERVLAHYDGHDAATRGARYREQGWSRYDENAPLYSRDEIERERGLYR